MQNLWEKIRGIGERANETTSVSIMDWAKMFQPGSVVNWQGMNYQAFTATPSGSFTAPVFTCERWRVAVFSEARFAWQRLRNGRPLPGGLFGTNALRLLENPWPGAKTRDLLSICELDAATSGNSYWTIENDWLIRLEPSTVKVITSSVVNPVSGMPVAEQLEGYAVVKDGKEIAIYAPEEIAHYKPMPDTKNRWVGQSWVAACMADVAADANMTELLRAIIANGAQLTHVVSLDPELTPAQFDNFIEKFNEAHKGPAQAGKTLFIQGGTDIKSVGQTIEEMAFKATQGAGEIRIASASGVPAVIAGFSEGLQGSALNSGNYAAAKENFVDGTICPLWGAFVEAFSSLLTAPGPDVRLWYDKRDIPFLAKDVQTEAAVLNNQATAINILITAGFEPDAVIAAVMANDVSGLVGNHSGMYSVQLQAPMTDTQMQNSNMPTKPMNGTQRPKAVVGKAQ